MKRLTAQSRARALEAGLWQRENGDWVPLKAMADGHLVNALLQALARSERPTLVRPLAAEVRRRRLESYAMAVAEERTRQWTTRS